MTLPRLNIKEALQLNQFFDHHLQEQIWRMGFYESPAISLKNGIEVAVKRIVRLLAGVRKSHRVLCLGSHGLNLALYLIGEYQCKVELFCDENSTSEADLKELQAVSDSDRLTIRRGSFQLIPYDYESFDLAISVDTFGLIEEKEQVLRQISYVMKPKSRIMLTSLFLQELGPTVADTGMNASLVSIEKYQKIASAVDLEQVLQMDMTDHIIQHYSKLLTYTSQEGPEKRVRLQKALDDKFTNWLTTYQSQLSESGMGWGILQFQKRNF